MSDQTYETVLAETFGDRAEAVRAEYPPETHGSTALAWAAVVTDRMWTCTQYTTSRGLAARTPVYHYEFADPAPPPLPKAPPTMPMGTPHASDLWSFYNLGGYTPDFTPAQQRLSTQMIDYWSAFATTGDPDRAPGPAWPRLTRRAPYVQSLAPDAIARTDLATDHHRDFWAAQG